MLAILGCCNNLPGCGTAVCSVKDKHTHIGLMLSPNFCLLFYKNTKFGAKHWSIPTCLYFMTYFSRRLGTWLEPDIGLLWNSTLQFYGMCYYLNSCWESSQLVSESGVFMVDMFQNDWQDDFCKIMIMMKMIISLALSFGH